MVYPHVVDKLVQLRPPPLLKKFNFVKEKSCRRKQESPPIGGAVRNALSFIAIVAVSKRFRHPRNKSRLEDDDSTAREAIDRALTTKSVRF